MWLIELKFEITHVIFRIIIRKVRSVKIKFQTCIDIDDDKKMAISWLRLSFKLIRPVQEDADSYDSILRKVC